MKYLAIVLMLLGVGLFSIGCEEAPPTLPDQPLDTPDEPVDTPEEPAQPEVPVGDPEYDETFEDPIEPDPLIDSPDVLAPETDEAWEEEEVGDIEG